MKTLKRVILITLIISNVVLLGLVASQHAEAVPYDIDKPVWVPYDQTTKVIRDITFDSARDLCNTLNYGDTVIMSSGGGNITAGFMMMGCLQDLDISMIVIRAYSISPVIAFAANKVCLNGITPDVIGAHMPARSDGIELSPLEYSEIYFWIEYNIVASGGSFGAAERFTAYMKTAAAYDMTIIPTAKFARMLGSKFIGTCKTITRHEADLADGS